MRAAAAPRPRGRVERRGSRRAGAHDPRAGVRDRLRRAAAPLRAVTAAEAPPNRLADVDHDLPLAGAIAFHQSDALPGTKQESASPDRNCLRRAQDHGLEVRGAIVVDLVVLPDTLGEEAVERAHHIQAEPGIGVLVDDDGRRRMTDEDSADPLIPRRPRQHLGDVAGDVHHFLVLRSLDPEYFLHRRASLDNTLHREAVSFTMPYADLVRPMGSSL